MRKLLLLVPVLVALCSFSDIENVVKAYLITQLPKNTTVKSYRVESIEPLTEKARRKLYISKIVDSVEIFTPVMKSKRDLVIEYQKWAVKYPKNVKYNSEYQAAKKVYEKELSAFMAYEKNGERLESGLNKLDSVLQTGNIVVARMEYYANEKKYITENLGRCTVVITKDNKVIEKKDW